MELEALEKSSQVLCVQSCEGTYEGTRSRSHEAFPQECLSNDLEASRPKGQGEELAHSVGKVTFTAGIIKLQGPL